MDLETGSLIPGVAVRLAALAPPVVLLPPPLLVLLLELELLDPHPAANAVAAPTQTATVNLVRVPLMPLLLESSVRWWRSIPDRHAEHNAPSAPVPESSSQRLAQQAPSLVAGEGARQPARAETVDEGDEHVGRAIGVDGVVDRAVLDALADGRRDPRT